MKNLKFYSFITLLVIVASLFILSCSKDEENIQDNNIITNETTSRLASTTCDIVGPLNVSSGTYTYTYTDDSGNTNINWTITPSSAANILSGQGTSTITITFNSSCTISAYGTGGTGGACEDIISITKSNGACCDPTFDAFYICDGTPKGKGAVVPFVNGCDVSTISSIVWDLGGAKWVAGPLAGQSGGTMFPPFNQYSKNIGYYQCQYGMFQISATYNFNNGCPPKTYNLDVTPSN